MKKSKRIIISLILLCISIVMLAQYYFMYIKEPLISFYNAKKIPYTQLVGILVTIVILFLGIAIGFFVKKEKKDDGIILKWLKENFNDIKFEINDEIKISPIIVVLASGGEIDGSEITVKNSWSGKTKLHKCLYLTTPAKLNKEKLAKLLLEDRVNVKFFDAEQ